MLTTAEIATAFSLGTHGTTFGGNPVTCAAALAAVNEIARPELLAHVRTVAAQLRSGLEALASRHPTITQVRGVGLMLGAVLDQPGQPIVEKCLQAGLLINCTADRVLRFVPPLILTPAQVDEGLAILDQALTP